MRENPIFGQIFPQGEKLPEEFSAYFIGQAYRAPRGVELSGVERDFQSRMPQQLA